MHMHIDCVWLAIEQMYQLMLVHQIVMWSLQHTEGSCQKNYAAAPQQKERESCDCQAYN